MLLDTGRHNVWWEWGCSAAVVEAAAGSSLVLGLGGLELLHQLLILLCLLRRKHITRASPWNRASLLMDP